MDTVAFIPVRGGSKSIPYKNIKPLCGEPLVHWTMKAALDCDKIDHLYVSSEDALVRSKASRIVDKRLSVIDRKKETATDDATTESALLDFASRYDFKRVVLIQATSPLLEGADLSQALKKLDATGADSLLSVVRAHRFMWKPGEKGTAEPVNYDPLKRPRRQDWEGELMENGAFYITSKEALMRSRCRISGKIAYYEMAPETSLELDEPHDWRVAEQILAGSTPPGDLAERCKKIALLITDMDGVLTDSGVFVGPDGELAKKFSTRDGMGFTLLRRAGIEAAIMTSEKTPIVKSRALKLKIERVITGVEDKGSAVEKLIKEENLDPTQVAFIGDEINDLPAFAKAGLTACPSNAVDEIKTRAHHICKREGGQGCVREFIDLILSHQG